MALASEASGDDFAISPRPIPHLCAEDVLVLEPSFLYFVSKYPEELSQIISDLQ